MISVWNFQGILGSPSREVCGIAFFFERLYLKFRPPEGSFFGAWDDEFYILGNISNGLNLLVWFL